MTKPRVKKIRMIVSRADMDSVLREMISLGCIEVTEPDPLPDDMESASLITRETYTLDGLRTNREQLELLGTEYTLILTGWISSKTEPSLISILDNHTCAWEIENPSDNEPETIPVILSFPGLFGGIRGKNRRLFDPLQSAKEPEVNTADPADTEEAL